MSINLWSDAFEIISIAIGVGFVNGAIPGPLLALMCVRILDKGYFSAMRVPFLAVGVVGIVVASAFLGILHYLEEIPEKSYRLLTFLGGFYLLFLGQKVARKKQISQNFDLITDGQIVIATLLNGSLWWSWLIVFLPQALALGELFNGGEWVFLILYQFAWVMGFLAMGGLFSLGRRHFVQSKSVNFIFRFFGSVLFVLGIFMIRAAWK